MVPHDVTVVIPTYNRAAFLAEAIQSVLEQQGDVREIIVADDGSTDETATRVARMDGPIRHLRLPHSGRPSVARNRAVEVTSTSLVAFLDDDDCWEPHKLARQLRRLTEPSIGFVYSDVRLRFGDGRLSEPVLRPRDKREGDIFDVLLHDCAITPSSVIVRRDLLLEVGGFDESMASSEDYDLWLRLAWHSHAAFVDEPLVQLRRHPGEISITREIEGYRNVVRSLEQTRQRALTNQQRLTVRRQLARHHTTLARLLAQRGEHGSRRHAIAALRLNPLLRPAWRVLLGVQRFR